MALIDISQKITSRLPIEPVKNEDKQSWKYDGLCPAVLHSVELRDQTDSEGEFANITRKVLDITFANYKLPNSVEPDRFTTLSEKAIGTKMTKDGSPLIRPEVDILTNNNDMFKRIAHIAEQCSTSPTYRDIKTITPDQQAKYFDLPGLVTAATNEEAVALRVAAYDKFLTFMCDWFNGDAKAKTKSIFRNAEGVSIIHGWLKVLPAYPKRNYYAIPNWVSQGFFEYASIDPQTKLLRKPMIVKIKATETLDLLKAPVSGATTDASLPTIPGASASMLEFLKSQGQQ